MAVVDSNYVFKVIDVGGYGSQSDGGTLKASEFGSALYGGKVALPPPIKLPGSDIVCPHVFVADNAFQLAENVMKPYPEKNLADSHRIYNYRLSRARRCVENAFGVMTARWRIFERPLRMDPKNADNVVKAAVALHNYLIMTDFRQPMQHKYAPKKFVDYEAFDGSMVDGEWRIISNSNTSSTMIRNSTSNNYSTRASTVRENFKEFFLSEAGRIPWQDNVCANV